MKIVLSVKLFLTWRNIARFYFENIINLIAHVACEKFDEIFEDFVFKPRLSVEVVKPDGA